MSVAKLYLCLLCCFTVCRYVDIHYQLVPYLLSTGTNAYYNKKSSLTPLAAYQNFIEKVILEIHNYVHTTLITDLFSS